MKIFTRLRIVLPLLAATLAACRDGAGPDQVVGTGTPQVRLLTPARLTVAADTVRVRAVVTGDNLRRVDLLTPMQYVIVSNPDRNVVTHHAVDTLVSLLVGANEIIVSAHDAEGNQTTARITATRTAAPNPARFDAVVAHVGHGCGLRSGAALCWGFGSEGELGNGRSIPRGTPVPVAGGLTFASLSAAAARTCGLTPAGEAYCWGSDFFGALGRGSAVGGIHPTPQRVAPDVRFASLSAGAQGSTTCAVAVSGEAYCWGMNNAGQVGVPPTAERCANAVMTQPCVVTPARVQGGLRFTSVSVGTNSACGIAVGGRAYCWGTGMLGNGVADTRSDTPVPVAGGHLFTTISVGTESACGVATTGDAYCWGSNSGGGLGDGTTQDRLVPTRVASAVRFRSVGVVPEQTIEGVAPGACALGEDGVVYCWGAGRLLPGPLQGGLTFTRLSSSHNCGITADRAAYCWSLTKLPAPAPAEY